MGWDHICHHRFGGKLESSSRMVISWINSMDSNMASYMDRICPLLADSCKIIMMLSTFEAIHIYKKANGAFHWVASNYLDNVI